MFHTAVGHVELWDTQYLLKNKRIEAEIKTKAFILVVQPALFPSSREECSQNTCHGPWSSSCLSEKSTSFSRELLPLQRSNSRPTFVSRLSTQLSLHLHCTEGAEVCTFILENVGYQSECWLWDFWHHSDFLTWRKNCAAGWCLTDSIHWLHLSLSASPLSCERSDSCLWFSFYKMWFCSSQQPSPWEEYRITEQLENINQCLHLTPPQEQKSLSKNRKEYIWKWLLGTFFHSTLKVCKSLSHDNIKVNTFHENLLLYLKNKIILDDTSERNIKHDDFFRVTLQTL